MAYNYNFNPQAINQQQQQNVQPQQVPETLYDHTETSREKDVIKEHIDKLKKL